MPATAWTRAKDWLSPLWQGPGGQCLLCRQWSRQRICPDCLALSLRQAGHAPACERCALPLQAGSGPHCPACLRQPPSLDRCVATLSYRHPWDRLLLDFKFNAQPQLARPLAALMADALQGRARPTLLCCVPLSAQRLRERGYDQGHELARRLAGPLRLPYVPRLLIRLPGAPQSRLDAAARRHHVRGAFLLAPGAAPRIRGACVAVVDDVMTTGVTLNEVAATLKRAGAAEVWGWALMRAG